MSRFTDTHDTSGGLTLVLDGVRSIYLVLDGTFALPAADVADRGTWEAGDNEAVA